MKKKWYLKGTVLLAGTGLAAALIFCPGSRPEPESEASVTIPAGSDAQQTAPEDQYHSGISEDKAETVYVKADAEGNVLEITVEDILKNPGSQELIPDFSSLKNIKNTKGDEEYTQEADGTIFWENHGADISYKGSSEALLPVTVKISYYLNGQPISPEKLAGQSGKVRIRFDYENRTLEETEINGKTLEVPVPFAALSAAFLPSDVFSHVEVENGKLISMGDQNMVVGFACPSLGDFLNLADYEPTEDIKIPDYVEITADTSAFELNFTATVLSTGLFSELEDTDLSEIDDLIDDMAELSDASKELTDGTGELSDGVEELRDGVKEYTDGVSTVDEAVSEVRDALDLLDDQKYPLREGALALSSGLDALLEAITQAELPKAPNMEEDSEDIFPKITEDLTILSASLASLQETYSEEEEIPQELSAMADAVEDLASQMENLFARSEELAETMTGVSDSLLTVLGSLKDSVSQLAEGSRQLSDGVQAYTHGVSELYRGSLELADGTEELSDAGKELNDGLTELADGVQELRDGVEEFDEEGIQELTKLAGDDLDTIIQKVRALKEADSRYMNFSGIRDGQTGNVKFIIETEEISRSSSTE